MISWLQDPIPIKEDEFRCDSCDEIYKKCLSDEEAKKQFEIEFPGLDWSPNLAIICQDCYDEAEGKGGKEWRKSQEYLKEEQ